MEGTPIRTAAAFARTTAATSAAKVRGHLGRPGHARDGSRRGAGLSNRLTRQEGDVEDAVAQVPPDEVRNRASACNEGGHQTLIRVRQRNRVSACNEGRHQ